MESSSQGMAGAGRGLKYPPVPPPCRVPLRAAGRPERGEAGAQPGSDGTGRDRALTLARLAACIAMSAGGEWGPRPGTETAAGKEAGVETAARTETGAVTPAGTGSDGRDTRLYPSRHRARPSRNRIYPGVHRAGSGSALPPGPSPCLGPAPPGRPRPRPPALQGRPRPGPARSIRGARIAM